MPEVGEIKKAKEIGYKGYGKYIWHACLDCGKERWVHLIYGKPSKVRCQKCSEKGIRHSQYGKRGEQSISWRGGIYRDKNGYAKGLQDGRNKRIIELLQGQQELKAEIRLLRWEAKECVLGV